MSAQITLPDDGKPNVFVFGSNMNGYHGAGAARFARVHYNAKMGVVFGHTGEAFAIPTMGENFTPLGLSVIREYVVKFLTEARNKPDHVYYLTPIGCGIAGFTAEQIAPLFKGAPSNVRLPDEFTAVLTSHAKPSKV
jgi:hypothetical protein